ncbi:hypothetical protein [Methylobrevis albus]|uniref:Uncharacterized protein n=1 Tax=Methylobrevis albus TaxID=2793297 RepID=A0A931HZ49_9HYPH|nr:hypothetical protein [Methylobrevis albus]MBH0237120.1 hypothetical protein [Methylobrevis albus]
MSATDQSSTGSRRQRSASLGARAYRILDVALVAAAFAVIVATTLVGAGGF